MSSLENLTVSDVMTTAVLTVRAGDELASAAQEMRQADIRHLPVVDDRGRVIGVISDRDLLRADVKSHPHRKVAGIMTADVLSIRPGTAAREATVMMLEYKVSCLPVTNDLGELVGLVTETDFLRILNRMLGGGVIER
jgi:CBS domain-containing protein